MKKISLFILSVLILTVLFFACNKEKKLQNITNLEQQFMSGTSDSDVNFVPYDLAEQIAERMQPYMLDSTQPWDGNFRDINSSMIIPEDESGKNALYIFNYTDGGFLIMSADKRYQPILAYGAQGSFNVNDTIPSALENWLSEMVENISFIKNDIYTENDDIGYYEWSLINGMFDEIEGPAVFLPRTPYDDGITGGFGCTPTVTYNTTVGRLMNTTWGQGCGYNNLLANDCVNDDCNRRVTGCVATAMAQIIRYWNISTSHNYNYGIMPNNTGSNETSRLMSDAGQSVFMNYGCDESGANDAHIPGALFAHFNFKPSSLASYDISKRPTVFSNLDNNRPVILGGYRARTQYWFFFIPSGGHTWVCDGYRIRGNNCDPQYWYHMNWGWNGDWNDWYFVNNWTVGTQNFQFAQNFIYNIRP